MITFPCGISDYHALSPDQQRRLYRDIVDRLKATLLLYDTTCISLMEFLGSAGFYVLYDTHFDLLQKLFGSSALGFVSFTSDKTHTYSGGRLIEHVCNHKIERKYGTHLPEDVERRFAERLKKHDMQIVRVDEDCVSLALNKRLASSFTRVYSRWKNSQTRDRHRDAAMFATSALRKSGFRIETSHLGDDIISRFRSDPYVVRDYTNYLKIRMVREMAEMGGLDCHLDASNLTFEGESLDHEYARGKNSAWLIDPLMRVVAEAIINIDFLSICDVRNSANWRTLRSLLRGSISLSPDEVLDLVRSIASDHIPNLNRSGEMHKLLDDAGLLCAFPSTLSDIGVKVSSGDDDMSVINVLQIFGSFRVAVSTIAKSMPYIKNTVSAMLARKQLIAAAEAIHYYPRLIVNTVCMNTFVPISDYEAELGSNV